MSDLLPMPCDMTAERALIGSCLIPGKTAKWATIRIESEAFYSDKHRHIAKAIYDLTEIGTDVDIVTVSSALRESGKLAEVGGPQYLKECQDAVVVTDHAEHYGRIIQKAYYDREIIKSSLKISDAIHRADQDAANEAMEVQAKWHRLSASVGAIQALSLRESLINVLCAIDEKKAPDIVRLGIPGLDDIMGGTRKGHLVTVGARPRVGKTATMATMGVYCAGQKKRVGFFCAEMPGDEITQRILSAQSGVPHWRLYRNRLDAAQIQTTHDSASDISDFPFYYNETHSPRIEDIRKFAEHMTLDVVFVDYLTRCTLPRGENMRVQVNKFMTGLKNLAKSGFVVVLGAQVNRNADRETDRAPLLSDLKESSAIEEESDAVILLHSKREDLDNQDLDTIDLQFHIAKNRHGKMGKVLVPFRRDILRIGEKTREGPIPSDLALSQRDHAKAAAHDLDDGPDVPF